jgi:hypothetical protein
MTDPISLDEKRRAKQTRCDFCGKPAHEFAGQCERIASITEEADGAITYHLYPIEDPPSAA